MDSKKHDLDSISEKLHILREENPAHYVYAYRKKIVVKAMILLPIIIIIISIIISNFN